MHIREKIMLSLVLVFAALLGGINFLLSENIRSSNTDSINRDLAAVESNGRFYVNQTMIIGGVVMDAEGFSLVAKDAVTAIAGTTSGETAAYDLSGTALAASDPVAFSSLTAQDLTLALAGKSAYYADTDEDGKTWVRFSYPVFSDGQMIGVLRSLSDYTALYDQGEVIRRSINLITLVGFGVCLVLSALISQSITSPIRRLSANLNSATRWIGEGRLAPEKVKDHIHIDRRDEIGMLARNVLRMVNRINHQMETINRDRTELTRVSEYRRDFYNSVTHELKTPLTSIRGYAEVLRDNGFTDREFFDQAVTRIIEESERMHTMVVDLLDNANLNSPIAMPMERVELSALVRDVTQTMQVKAEKYGCELVTALADAPMLANTQEMRQLVINLLDNAIKYSTGSHRIDVSVAVREQTTVLTLINDADPIGRDELDKLFLPYYQHDRAARERGSRGLGLNICRQIAERHHGALALASDPAGRFTVTATFPLLTQPAWEAEL